MPTGRGGGGGSPFGRRPASGAGPVGVVLAGGSSRRLGRDKTALTVDGATLVERAAGKLARCCAEVLIADRGRRLDPVRESVADGGGRGPAAGLLGAAGARPGRALLALACDLPFAPEALLAELAGWDEVDLAAPRWASGVEPLCALYGPAALERMAERATAGRFALHPLFEAAELGVRWLDGKALARHGDPERMFFNVNEPQDLERLR